MNDKYRKLLIEFASKHHFERAQKYGKTENASILTETLPTLLAEALSLPGNYEIKGSVGRGNWAEIPSVVILDTDVSRTTGSGYYVALLFNARLDTLYLTLTTGRSQFKDAYETRVGKNRMRAFTQACARALTIPSTYGVGPIDLSARLAVGKGYEQGTIVSKKYDITLLDAIELIADIQNFLSLHRELKQAVGGNVVTLTSENALVDFSKDSEAQVSSLNPNQEMSRTDVPPHPLSTGEASRGKDTTRTFSHAPAPYGYYDLHEGHAVSTENLPYNRGESTLRDSEVSWLYATVVAFLIVLISTLGYLRLSSGNQVDAAPSSLEGNTTPTLLSELGSAIQPVGYFDDMSLFPSTTLSPEEWRTHVTFFNTKDRISETPPVPKEQNGQIFSSVVKIVCEHGSRFIHSSGTNVDPSGYVLTNLHFVENLREDACIVGFVNTDTGKIEEAYWTSIITDKENKTGYDLAYLTIERPVFDVQGNVYGYYDTILNGSFPYFAYTNACGETDTQPGDEVLMVGYSHVHQGGQVVTSGFLSSLDSQEGYILSSASAEMGTSGGLATREDGCYVGVPRIMREDTEKDEIHASDIIGAQLVYEFDTAINDDFSVYYKSHGIEL